MIKDVFVLNKNAWHSKLMTFIWGFDTSDFSHMCPYFWVSVLNLLVVIPVIIVRLVILVAKKIGSHFTKYKRALEEEFDRSVKDIVNMVVDDLGLMECIVDDYYADLYDKRTCSKISKAVFRELYHYYYLSTDARERFEELRSKYDALYGAESRLLFQQKWDRKEQRIKNWQSNKQKINNLVKIAKPLGRVFIYVSTAFGLWCVFLAGKALVHWLNSIPHVKWMDFWGLLGLIVLAVIVMILFILGLKRLVIYIQYDMSDKAEARVEKFIYVSTKPFIWFWQGIKLFGQLVYAIYKNNCPAISWK